MRKQERHTKDPKEVFFVRHPNDCDEAEINSRKDL
jgi:hypothetical protein